MTDAEEEELHQKQAVALGWLPPPPSPQIMTPEVAAAQLAAESRPYKSLTDAQKIARLHQELAEERNRVHELLLRLIPKAGSACVPDSNPLGIRPKSLNRTPRTPKTQQPFSPLYFSEFRFSIFCAATCSARIKAHSSRQAR